MKTVKYLLLMSAISEKQIVSAQNENAEQIKLEKTAKKDIKNTKEINQKKKEKPDSTEENK